MKSHTIIFAKLSFQELWSWIQYDCSYSQVFCFPFIAFTMKERNPKCLHFYLMFLIQIALTDLLFIYSRFQWCPAMKAWWGLSTPLSRVWDYCRGSDVPVHVSMDGVLEALGFFACAALSMTQASASWLPSCFERRRPEMRATTVQVFLAAIS